ATNRYPIAGTQPANLNDSAVDAGAVGAFQIRQDDLFVVGLHLGVKATDPLIVEANDIALLPANADGGRQIPKRASFINSFQDLKGYHRHQTAPPTFRQPSVNGLFLFKHSCAFGSKAWIRFFLSMNPTTKSSGTKRRKHGGRKIGQF